MVTSFVMFSTGEYSFSRSFQTSSSPPHVEVVVCSEVGTPSRVAVPKGPNNLFRALLSFVMHVKVGAFLTLVHYMLKSICSVCLLHLLMQ